MKKLILTFLSIVFVASSCNEDVLNIKSQNNYDDATYFKSSAQFNEAVTAIYATFLQTGMFAREYYYIFDLLGNEASNNTFLLGDLAQFQDYSFVANNDPINSLWKTLYRMVLRANLVIERADTWLPTLQADIDSKARFVAEAKFLRAFAYFTLVNAWGRVPLTLKYSEATTIKPRADVSAIWAAIEKDLIDAASVLPVAYASADLGHATKGAATALLGKTYLYQKKFTQAETTLTQLTQPPYTYVLNSSYENQFSSSNNTSLESIFDIQHRWYGWGQGNQYYVFGGQEAWGGQTTHTARAQEYGFNDWNNVFISDAAKNAFKYKNESSVDYTDPRAKFVFYGDAPSGGDTDYCNQCDGGAKPFPFNSTPAIQYNWKKYEYYESVDAYYGPASEINSQVIRYADVLLMLAEAQIENGKIPSALLLINQVRTRSGAFTYSTLGDKVTATDILRRERQLELVGEQSRWFDLNRWGIAKTVLNNEKQSQLGKQPFQDKNVLLPIPSIEKSSNPLVAADINNNWN